MNVTISYSALLFIRLSHVLHVHHVLFVKSVSMFQCCILLSSINQLFHLSQALNFFLAIFRVHCFFYAQIENVH